jgi:Putative MetA-pathway of phenol degradation
MAAVAALGAGLGCALPAMPAGVHAANDALPAVRPANESPLPHLKPLQRDRSDQVVALLARAATVPAPLPKPAPKPSPAAARTLAAGAPHAQGSADEEMAGSSPAPHEVAPPNASAPADASQAIAELRDELEARDLLIANLLQRVEQLERRIVLSASQLDQTVGGAGPGASSGRVFAETAPAANTATVGALEPVEPGAGAQKPVQTAQAQPPAPPAPTEGGAAPTQAPGQFEVDEEAIERALERTLVQEGVLLLPFGQVEIEPSFTYTRRESDVPTFVAVGGDTFVGEQEVKRNEFEMGAMLRVGLPFDAQIEAGVPYNYVDESVDTTVGGAPRNSNSESGHGLGDVSVGLAKTLLREGAGWWPDVIARVTWDADTGKTRDNGVFLGGGFNELSGSLSAVKRQDPLAFVGSVSYAKTFENDDFEPGDEVGFSLGTVLAASPETSLSFFFNQTFADDSKFDGDTINGSDQVVGTFSIGAATILGRNTLLSITGEIGLTDDAPDYAIGASLPIRFDLPTF